SFFIIIRFVIKIAMNKNFNHHLKSLGFRCVGENLWVRPDEETIQEKLSSVDLVVSDLDECMYPFITQAAAALLIFRRVASSPFNNTHLPLLPHIAPRLIRMLLIKSFHILSGRANNSILIREYEDYACGIPGEYFAEETRKFLHYIRGGVVETLLHFKDRNIPVGIVSLSFDLIVGEIYKFLNTKYGLKIDFYDCSAVEVDELKRFKRFDPSRRLLTSEDKGQILKARMAEYNSKCPLVIGHDQDDADMMLLCAETGGVRIGISPKESIVSELDIVVTCKDWQPLVGFLNNF
ncbi:MAG: hypothetical protein AB1546_15505, partial [bacterium]